MKTFILLLLLVLGCDGKNNKTSLKEEKFKDDKTLLKERELFTWTDWVLKRPEASTACFGRSYISDKDRLTKSLAVIGMDLVEINKTIEEFIDYSNRSFVDNDQNWLGNKPPKDFLELNTAIKDDDHPFKFAQKAIFPSNSKIVVMGDFHGSLHSLIRNLWRLEEQGHINDDLIISKDTYFVFNGDFVDRGRYGAEVVYTLLRLKLKNPNQVFLLRGNHELSLTSYDYGLLRELKGKYGDDKGEKLYTKMINLFRFLPVVLLVGVKKTDGGHNFVQFCHGGFSYDGVNFLYNPKKLINDKTNKTWQQVEHSLGFMWSDFEQIHNFGNSQRGYTEKEGVVVIGPNLLDRYLKENNLQAIFRGHQDRDMVLKVLAHHNVSQAKKEALKAYALPYTNFDKSPLGPYDWADALSALNNQDEEFTKGLKKLAYIEGIKIFDYDLANVFTFTTAIEGQGEYLDYEGYGILETSNNFKEWNMRINEHELKDRVKEFYSTIILKKPIDFRFNNIGPGRILLQ